MAQTTNAMNTVDGKIEINIAGGGDTDISGYANSLTVSDATVQSGNIHTADGQFPIIKAGKADAITITIGVVYTEQAAEWKAIYDGWIAKSTIVVTWSPGGGDIGDYEFVSGTGIIKSCSLPPVDPNSAGPHVATLVVEVPSVATPSVIS